MDTRHALGLAREYSLALLAFLLLHRKSVSTCLLLLLATLTLCLALSTSVPDASAARHGPPAPTMVDLVVSRDQAVHIINTCSSVFCARVAGGVTCECELTGTRGDMPWRQAVDTCGNLSLPNPRLPSPGHPPVSTQSRAWFIAQGHGMPSRSWTSFYKRDKELVWRRSPDGEMMTSFHQINNEMPYYMYSDDTVIDCVSKVTSRGFATHTCSQEGLGGLLDEFKDEMGQSEPANVPLHKRSEAYHSGRNSYLLPQILCEYNTTFLDANQTDLIHKTFPDSSVRADYFRFDESYYQIQSIEIIRWRGQNFWSMADCSLGPVRGEPAVIESAVEQTFILESIPALLLTVGMRPGKGGGQGSFVWNHEVTTSGGGLPEDQIKWMNEDFIRNGENCLFGMPGESKQYLQTADAYYKKARCRERLPAVCLFDPPRRSRDSSETLDALLQPVRIPFNNHFCIDSVDNVDRCFVTLSGGFWFGLKFSVYSGMRLAVIRSEDEKRQIKSHLLDTQAVFVGATRFLNLNRTEWMYGATGVPVTLPEGTGTGNLCTLLTFQGTFQSEDCYAYRGYVLLEATRDDTLFFDFSRSDI